MLDQWSFQFGVHEDFAPLGEKHVSLRNYMKKRANMGIHVE